MDAATRDHLPVELDHVPGFATDVGYGYQRWTVRYRTPEGGELFSPAAVGNGDQRVILVPELELSVTLLAGFYDDPSPEVGWIPDRIVVEHLIPALEGRRASGAPRSSR